MEYVQERIATLHSFSEAAPPAPTHRTAVVVPMTQREFHTPAAARVLTELERISPDRVIIPLRTDADSVDAFRMWLSEFDLNLELLWCSGPAIADLLASHGLNGTRGKGRDLWLALGLALDSEFVAVHDADTKTYDATYVPRLVFPLAHGYTFSKGYYARIENNRFYGRLFRLFYAPIIRALSDAHDAEILGYFGAFRYALAGEFAGTAELLEQVRIPRSWGLEVGTLGEVFPHAGFDRTAQVDLGRYEHEHRSVEGPTGLSDMSRSVGQTLFRTLGEHGVDSDFETLPGRYRAVAGGFVDQYALDAAFNGFEYDRAGELEQIEQYADAIAPPINDDRLPAWADAPIDPDDVRAAAAADLADASPPVQ